MVRGHARLRGSTADAPQEDRHAEGSLRQSPDHLVAPRPATPTSPAPTCCCRRVPAPKRPFARAIAADEGFALAHIALARTLQISGRGNEVKAPLARAQRAGGRHDAARTEPDRHLRQDPDRPGRRRARRYPRAHQDLAARRHGAGAGDQRVRPDRLLRQGRPRAGSARAPRAARHRTMATTGGSRPCSPSPRSSWRCSSAGRRNIEAALAAFPRNAHARAHQRASATTRRASARPASPI